MALKKTPVTGMRDITPAEMEIRDYLLSLIKETYREYGFSGMETPCVEHIENLTSKQGGDNEKLIFKILKRGNKLRLEDAKSEADLVDGGLRYDLTLPLSRYYANNAANLPSPFKALQIGNVWRADKPQRGRFRQFVQCDIDILGEASYLAEVELILATSTLMGKMGFQGFKVRINDRRILKAMAAYCGFPEESCEQVFIILDKMDKIGREGVAAELVESGFSKDSVDKYMALFDESDDTAEGVRRLGETLEGVIEPGTAENLEKIMTCVEKTAVADFKLAFDPTLVRGMSYYTGTIFEIEIEQFGGSVGGGGRYDEMIGKFTGMKTPACGFSIGFERIVTVLLESGYTVPGGKEKIAYLMEKGLDADMVCQVIADANQERAKGVQVLVAQMNKNKKFQKDQLMKEGYTEFKEFYKDSLKK